MAGPSNPVGCLGRVLTFLGVIWLAFVVLGSIGLLSEVGIGEGFFVGAVGSAIPAVLLLAAGRALRRRGRTIDEQSRPAPVPMVPASSEKRVPTSRTVQPTEVVTPPILLGSPTPRTQLRPKPPSRPVEPVAGPEVIPDVETPSGSTDGLPPIPTPSPPKTSRELIEEARKRWGRGGRTSS
jgi:hypothetical protein